MRETFCYDESCPSHLRWLCTREKGKPAGSLNGSGQYEVYFEGRLQQAHRIVYQMMVGEIPDGHVIDHINGDRSDNRPSNLRAVTPMVNARNRKKSVVNTSGKTGVYPFKNKQGVVIGYRASWQLLDGYKRQSKLFTFSKYGEDALNAAAYWRGIMIDFLNADGAGYTEDHGTR